jgi:hypothetical protein
MIIREQNKNLRPSALPVCDADITAICVPNVWTVWNPRNIKPL